MKIHFTCLYCNNKWSETYYKDPMGVRCYICNDKNLKMAKEDTTTVDYYVGSPPFPEKPILEPAYNEPVYHKPDALHEYFYGEY